MKPITSLSLRTSSLYDFECAYSWLEFLQGFVGLGAAIMTQLFYGLHPSDPKSFLLMAACLPASVSLLFMAVIRPIPASERDLVQDQEAGGNFKLFSLVSILLAVYLMGVIILQNVVLIGSSAVSLVICVVILFLLLLHFGVVINFEIKTYNDQLRLKEPLLNVHESWRSNSFPGSPFGPEVDQEFSVADLTDCYNHSGDGDIQSCNRRHNNSIPGSVKQPSPSEAGVTSKLLSLQDILPHRQSSNII